MRKYIGFFLLCAGLSFGAFAYYPGALDEEARLAEITTILAAPAGDMTRRVPETTGSLRSFAPKHEIKIAPPAAARPAAGETVVAMAPRATVPEAVPQPAPQIGQTVTALAPAASGWQAVVTPDPGSVPTGVTSSKPGDGHARYELVLDLQRELKRAGCYGGTLSGSWNANTKRAMTAFMDRVNATLPMEEPDYILLTLLRGHTAATCVTCPMGQSLSQGRCKPNAIIAQQADKKAAPKAQERKLAAASKAPQQSGWTTSVAEAETRALAPPAAPLPGRMAVGAPLPEAPAPRPAAQAAAQADGWQLKVVPTPAVKPAPAAAEPPPAAVPAKIAALEAEDDASDTSASGTPAAAAAPDAMPAAGLPGSKSGGTARLPSWGSASPAPVPRPVYNAPNPRPRASASRPRATASAKPHRGARRSGTRSVQSLFMHPLGRM